MPGQSQQLSEAASTAEGAKILEIRNMQGELIYRSIWVTNLHRPDRRSDQADGRQFALSGHPVIGRRHERKCDLERKIARAGAGFTQCTSDVVLMGESVENKLASRFFGSQAEQLNHWVDLVPPEVKQFVDAVAAEAIDLRTRPLVRALSLHVE